MFEQGASCQECFHPMYVYPLWSNHSPDTLQGLFGVLDCHVNQAKLQLKIRECHK